MSRRFLLAGLAALAGFIFGDASAQEVRRAQPVNEPPVGRAVPFDHTDSVAHPAPRPLMTPAPLQNTSSRSGIVRRVQLRVAPTETESPTNDNSTTPTRCLDANFTISPRPNTKNFSARYPGAPGRGSAYFYLGECYRALSRTAAAKSSFQTVIDHYGDSEFAGPAAYGVAEILVHAKRLRQRAPAFSSRRGQDQRIRAGSFGTIFRSALSRKFESER